MASSLWPRSGDRQLSNSGRVMPGARLYFFDAGTTTPQTTFVDAARTSVHPHPIESDGFGKWPAVYLAAGTYRYRIVDVEGAAVDDYDGIVAVGEPAPETGDPLTASPFVQTLLDDADAGAFLTTLGVAAFVQTILNDADAAAVRATIDAPQFGMRAIVADSASRTLALTDIGRTLEMSNGSARIYTIPANATVAFPIGTEFNIVRMGLGAVNITAASGVTFNGIASAGAATCAIDSQYKGVSLRKTAVNTWGIVGAHSTVT
jgi:hypothetical protein